MIVRIDGPKTRASAAMTTIGAHATQITITSDGEARALLDAIKPKTD